MNAVCEVCGAIGFEQLLLCCRDCKVAHTHQYCLKEVLFDAPKEGWSLWKVSTERPSNHAQFESTSQQPITTGINFAAPAPPQSPAPGITQDLGPAEKKVLAPIRYQDFHSACSLEAETGAMAAPIRIVENFQKMLPILETDVVTMTEKAAQNDAVKAKVDGLQGQVDKNSLLRPQLQEEKKGLAPLRERMASADAKHKSMKTQRETLRSQAKEIPEHRSKIGSLEQEKNDLQVDNSTEKTQCKALQSQVEEIPGLRSQVKELGKVRTALSGEKAGLEAELKSARSELEKCQIEVKSLRGRIRTLEEKEVAWLGLEERHKAAITAFKVERDKMIQDTEGSCSRSVGKVSSERPSNHGQFDYISQQPITTGINFAAPAPPQPPATGITQDLGPPRRKALAPIRCQDFHSAYSLEAVSRALAVCLPSHVQSKVITHNQRRAPEHDPATSVSPPPITESRVSAAHARNPEPPVAEHPSGVVLDGHRGTRTSVGSSETNKELTFEQVSRHFSMPIEQVAREMNMGMTFLKKQCRKLGLMRWPHRKVQSLQKLIDNVQELGKENAQENGCLTRSLVGFMQQAMKAGERPDVMWTKELRLVCFNENNAQEDGHLTRSVVECLQLTKKMIEERPDMTLDQRTKHLRQVCIKESYKRKRS